MTRQDEAARWFATLRRGVLTLEERGAYEAWAAQRANRAALAEMEEIWNSLEGGQRPVPARLTHKLMLATLCAVSLGVGVLAFAGSSGFFTQLDWINR